MGTALRACPLQTRLQGPAPSCSSACLPSPRCRRSAVRTVCQASATATATSDLVTLGEEYNKLMARQMQWDNPYEYHPERGGFWTVLTCDSLDGRTAWGKANWQAEPPWQLCGCHACSSRTVFSRAMCQDDIRGTLLRSNCMQLRSGCLCQILPCKRSSVHVQGPISVPGPLWPPKLAHCSAAFWLHAPRQVLPYKACQLWPPSSAINHIPRACCVCLFDYFPCFS